ncbi:MAG: hypothetical protein AAB268_04980 [Elusimicrobiota bacterium]
MKKESNGEAASVSRFLGEIAAVLAVIVGVTWYAYSISPEPPKVVKAPKTDASEDIASGGKVAAALSAEPGMASSIKAAIMLALEMKNAITATKSANDAVKAGEQDNGQ